MSKITLPIILFPHDFLNCGKGVDLVKTGKAVASTLAAAIVWIKAQWWMQIWLFNQLVVEM